MDEQELNPGPISVAMGVEAGGSGILNLTVRNHNTGVFKFVTFVVGEDSTIRDDVVVEGLRALADGIEGAKRVP